MQESAVYEVPRPVTISCACLATAIALWFAVTLKLRFSVVPPLAGIAWISAFSLFRAIWVFGDLCLEAVVGIARCVRRLVSR